MERQGDTVLEAVGAVATLRVVDERPGPEGLTRSHLRQHAVAGRESDAPFDQHVEHVGRVLLAVDGAPTHHLDLVHDFGEPEQMTRADVAEQVGALEDQHSLHERQHAAPTRGEVAMTGGS